MQNRVLIRKLRTIARTVVGPFFGLSEINCPIKIINHTNYLFNHTPAIAPSLPGPYQREVDNSVTASRTVCVNARSQHLWP